MIESLIKSTVAMGVLLGLYYILFEKEKMHRFNRFYLLSALVFSLALPLVIIPVYVETFTPSFQISGTSEMLMSPQVPYSAAHGTVYKPAINYIPYIIWSIYSIFTILLAVRFTINVRHFIKKSAKNEKIRYNGATLILLDEKTLPHTFLNYIFVNQEEYEAKMIEDELYTHELTHVKQKHTFDILFIEALKIVFWFNPLLYCYKKAIQLNHEFLADEKVIDSTANTVYYQKLLLDKAHVGRTFSMASNLTFSLTKKRFIMMTKTTSTTKAGFIKLAILPVVIALMMLLCTKTIAQQSEMPKLEELELSPEAEAKLERFRISEAEEAELRKTNPDMFSDDPAVYLKNTRFKFIDKTGKETIKNGYAQLSEKEKEKVMFSKNLRGMGYLEIQETPEETDAEFPGGYMAFTKFISNNITLPDVKNDMTIKLKYSFTIKTDGTLDDFKVCTEPQAFGDFQNTFEKLQKEVLAAIVKSPKWKPAMRNGKPINAGIDYPFTITLKVKP
ncbi:M56 family metallopeptidase [Flavobacterium hauense]